MLGLMEKAPRRWGPPPGRQENSGASDSERLTFPEEPRIRKRRIAFTRSSGSSLGSSRPRKVRFGSTPDTTVFAVSSSPSSRTTP